MLLLESYKGCNIGELIKLEREVGKCNLTLQSFPVDLEPELHETGVYDSYVSSAPAGNPPKRARLDIPKALPNPPRAEVTPPTAPSTPLTFLEVLDTVFRKLISPAIVSFLLNKNIKIIHIVFS
jgi:hypothetical protein